MEDIKINEHLIFSLKKSKGYNDKYEYELIFSSEPDTAFGVGWDKRTLNRTNKPESDFVQSIYTFQTDLDMVVITESDEDDYMGTQDEHVYENVCDGIIAMLWEREIPKDKKRIVFRYGMLLEEVVILLKEREIKIEKVKMIADS